MSTESADVGERTTRAYVCRPRTLLRHVSAVLFVFLRVLATHTFPVAIQRCRRCRSNNTTSLKSKSAVQLLERGLATASPNFFNDHAPRNAAIVSVTPNLNETRRLASTDHHGLEAITARIVVRLWCYWQIIPRALYSALVDQRLCPPASITPVVALRTMRRLALGRAFSTTMSPRFAVPYARTQNGVPPPRCSFNRLISRGRGLGLGTATVCRGRSLLGVRRNWIYSRAMSTNQQAETDQGTDQRQAPHLHFVLPRQRHPPLRTAVQKV